MQLDIRKGYDHGGGSSGIGRCAGFGAEVLRFRVQGLGFRSRIIGLRVLVFRVPAILNPNPPTLTPKLPKP